MKGSTSATSMRFISLVGGHPQWISLWNVCAVSLRFLFLPPFSQRRSPSCSRSQQHAVNATLRCLLLLHLLFNFCKLRLQNVKEWLQVMLCIVCTNGDRI